MAEAMTAAADTGVVSGYGDRAVYMADFEDDISVSDFARYSRIASCMVDFLAGRAVDAANGAVQEAVHWQIWFIRQRGSVAACMDERPIRESFGGYSVERAAAGDDGHLRLFGMEVCPMTVSVLRRGGVISLWI